jgi:CBS domain-containing protein
MAFDDAKDNFFSAARHGLKAQFTWINGRRIPAPELILEHLLPLARQGLEKAEVPAEDRERYLGTIEERVPRDQNGSLWMLRSLAAMDGQGTREQRHQALVATMLSEQQKNNPVHNWQLATLSGFRNWANSFRTLGQFMTTDLFTLRPDDLIDLAASMMDWRHIRHIPVEDNDGQLIGLVSHRNLLRLLSQRVVDKKTQPVKVKEVMKHDPLTATPDTPIIEAIELMREHRVGCLPIVEGNRLVGIITAYDFLAISADLIRKIFSEFENNEPDSDTKQ